MFNKERQEEDFPIQKMLHKQPLIDFSRYQSAVQLCSTISLTLRLYSRLFSLNKRAASEFAGEFGFGSHNSDCSIKQVGLVNELLSVSIINHLCTNHGKSPSLQLTCMCMDMREKRGWGVREREDICTFVFPHSLSCAYMLACTLPPL